MRIHLLILLFMTSAFAEVTITRIRVGTEAGPVLRRYAGIASRELARRYQVMLPVVAGEAPGSLALAVSPAVRGWAITPGSRVLRVEGQSELAAVHALGMAMRRLELAGGKLVYRGAALAVTPAVDLRGIYGPAHFKNPYEKLSTPQLGEIFEDWALWGATTTWNWVDTQMLPDPFSGKPGAAESLAYTRKVLASLGAAQAAGLEIGFTLGTNVVWLDQFRDHPELRAQMGDRLIVGQLLCPSLPGGREIIQGNLRRLLEEAQRTGLHIGSLEFYTRDPSGCADERCRPWSKTSLRVIRESVLAARQVYPKIRGDLITWYWTPQETREAAEWLAGAGSGDWLRYWFHHFPTWAPQPKYPDDVQLAAPVRLGGMYNLSAADNDVYGAEGGIIRLRYLEKLLPPFPQHRMQGFHGYTEGNYDDLNKVVALQMLIDPRRPVRETVEEYCRWQFGARPEQAAELAGLIIQLDDLRASAAELPAIIGRLLAIEKALPAWGREWRFAQLRLRAQIARANIEILDGLPVRGAEAGAPQAVDYKGLIGKHLREMMRRGLQYSTMAEVQNAATDGYHYLLGKDALVRKRAVMAHELMHVSGVDADQMIGLTNLHLGDWPVWWLAQHFNYYKVLRSKTVAEQHKVIEECWP